MDLFQFIIRENDTHESAITKNRKLFDQTIQSIEPNQRDVQELKRLTEEFEGNIGSTLNEYNKTQAGLNRIAVGRSLLKVFPNSDIATTFMEPEIPDLVSSDDIKSTLWRKQEISAFDILLETLNHLVKGPTDSEERKYKLDQYRLIFIKQLFASVRNNGLHPLIWQRSAEYKRYNVILDLKRRTGSNLQMMTLLTLQRIQRDFVQAFLQQKNFVANGEIIPHKQLNRILITETPLMNEEIPYFKNMKNVHTTEEFIRACDDVTNELINNPFVQGETGGEITVWSFLHPRIQSVSLGHIENGHYMEAVRNAVIDLNEYIKGEYKTYTGMEDDGTSLMQKAFSPNNPIFQLADLSTTTGKNIQQGYMEIFCGVVRAMRNPIAHQNLPVSQTECLEKLTLFSHLLHLYESSLKPVI